ncbi:unnamed protein product [Caenorhabditis brenneri]
MSNLPDVVKDCINRPIEENFITPTKDPRLQDPKKGSLEEIGGEPKKTQKEEIEEGFDLLEEIEKLQFPTDEDDEFVKV